MHNSKVDLIIGNMIVGDLTFERPPKLQAVRAVDGIAFTIPTTIDVTGSGSGDKRIVVLSNLRAVASFMGLDVGLAEDPKFYYHSGNNGTLVLRMSAQVVRAIERMRNGAAPTFTFELFAELAYCAPDTLIRGQPYPCARQASVTYDAEAWTKMLRTTGLGENVVVEIALPPDPGPPWDVVWKAIRTARDALQTGGETGWKAAIVECRVALEHWQQQIEQEDHGAGWTAPSPADRRTRTRKQRNDNVRWDLLQCAHEAAHTSADQWTRADAVMILATLASLVAIRDP